MKEFKTGTFNLRNLVLPNHPFYGNDKYTQEEYDKKKVWTCSQLAKMAAEIVGFQEVFHKAALEDVLQGTPLAANVIVLGETGDSPVVGLASSLPIIGIPESFEGYLEKYRFRQNRHRIIRQLQRTNCQKYQFFEVP